MFFFKYHFKIIIILSIILSGCKVQDPLKSHGILYLENRAKKLTINKSNKNDVVRIIGQPHIKDELENNSWIYLERTLSKGKYHELGRHILEKNNVLVLDFNKFGILKGKKFLKKEDINKIKFSKNETENDLTKKSFVQSFLQSIKQKMYGNRKTEF
tara:strand:- start:1279 stop:1749 length:471 start_codon:yes stop_codon:yes gene_type:complete